MGISSLLKKTSFQEINGWEDEDHLAALSCFRVSARTMVKRPYTTKSMGVDGLALAQVAQIALNHDMNIGENQNAAKAFFESWFTPYKIVPQLEGQHGFVTGYFEPEVSASPVKTEKFKYPILKRPDDLVAIEDHERPASMDPSFFFAKNTNGKLSEYPDRKSIETGILDGQNLELFWFENRIDIFFIHIQGSARLILPDNSVKRISYAGKTGHPFTAIGKILIDRGALTLENVTMQSIRAWLENNPSDAGELMWRNRSFIFFQEIDHPNPDLGPIAAAGVALTPGRSLAIDHRLQTFGTPIWVSTQTPIPGSSAPFQRLMIAQDTGSAIVGPARGDLYIGSGFEAGQIAGGVKNPAEFTVLLPNPKS